MSKFLHDDADADASDDDRAMTILRLFFENSRAKIEEYSIKKVDKGIKKGAKLIEKGLKLNPYLNAHLRINMNLHI